LRDTYNVAATADAWPEQLVLIGFITGAADALTGRMCAMLLGRMNTPSAQ
jgi:hypothetical protein